MSLLFVLYLYHSRCFIHYYFFGARIFNMEWLFSCTNIFPVGLVFPPTIFVPAHCKFRIGANGGQSSFSRTSSLLVMLDTMENSIAIEVSHPCAWLWGIWPIPEVIWPSST